jgi:hypothetical protein
LPAQNDVGYNCDGTIHDLGSVSTAQLTCPEKFLSPLYFQSFDETSQTWQASLVDSGWAGVQMGNTTLSIRTVDIVAYYDSNRMVKVAYRTSGGPWTYKVLDSQNGGWDSHNYLTLYVDQNFDLHLSGNHHGSPQNYWRSTGLDISSMTRKTVIGDAYEGQVTYPRFFRTAMGDLIFAYRNGYAGSDGVWY